MGFLKNLADQIKGLWARSSTQARTLYVVALVGCLGLIAAVGLWSARPEYVPLARDLSPDQVAQIVSKLEANGVSHKLNISGTTVLVPKSKWSTARLAAGDLVGPGSDIEVDSNPSFMDSPGAQREKSLRLLEQRLARRIMRMQGVSQASVQISQPEKSPFVRERRPTTASVQLDFQRGAVFSRMQSASVVALVAASVEGLQPKSVTVTDTRGRVLSSNADSASAEFEGLREHRLQIEAERAASALSLLTPMLGEGRAVVQVVADIDFTRIKRTEKSVDPTTKIKTKETISTSTGIPARAAAGAAGTASNLGGSGPSRSTTSSQSTETADIEYLKPPETEEITNIPPGAIKRLTIAATIDLSQVEQDPQSNTPPLDKAGVEELIKNAVGFDEQRGDTITVALARLPGPPAEDDANDDALVAQRWKRYSELLRNGSLGLAAIVALILGWLLLRKMKPVELPGGAGSGQTADRTRLLSDLSTQAQRDPETVSQIIAAWLDDPERQPDQTDTEQPQPRRAAA